MTNESLIYRAKTLKIMTAGQEDYLSRRMSSRGYRVNELLKLKYLAIAILNYMKNELDYDLDDIAKILFLS